MRDAGGLPGLLSSGEASDAVRGSGAWLAFWKQGGAKSAQRPTSTLAERCR